MGAPALDSIHHVAIAVTEMAPAVAWYTRTFRCRVLYQDATWAFLEFANTRLALVVAHQHPPHLAIVSAQAERFGTLQTHRDGTRSVYIKDAAGNAVEVMAEV